MPTQDLSKIHHLIGSLFTWPEKREDWEQYLLSEEQLASFRENGFLSGVKMLEESQIEFLKRELAELTNLPEDSRQLFYEYHSNESSNPETVLFHALGAWRQGQGFHDVLWNPRFLVASWQLLGNKPVRFWHDQLFAKPPNKGGVVAWHQDYSYWTRTQPMAHLTCWCGLDDANLENGCLQYIPGSHRWGLLEKPALAGDLLGILELLTDAQKSQFKPVAAPVKAGEAIFHHSLTLHGSGENKSPRPRRAFVLNIFEDGVKSASNETLLTGVPVVPTGEKMQGQFFPLLFSPKDFPGQ